MLDSEYHITVDPEPQAVDIVIANRVEQGDIVVTQDWGLAAVVLGKKASALSLIHIFSAAKGKEALFVSLYYLFVETNHLKPRYISFSVFDNHTVRHSNRSPSLSK